MDTPETLFLRAEELKAILNISRSTAYDLMKRNQLPGVVRFGRSVRISKRALEAWLQRPAVAGHSPH